MTKLVIDYPVKYTELSYGDVTFVLAHLYEKNQEYKEKIDYVKAMGRETMLDNGAWEFGSSMPIPRYARIIEELEPTYAVIPDVYKNRLQSEKMTSDFINYNVETKSKLMFVPQGDSSQEAIESYQYMTDYHGKFFDLLAIAKHLGDAANRIELVDLLYLESEIKPDQVHLLGFWDWEELAEYKKLQPWVLHSIDTKYPVKSAFMPHKFTDQLEYYNTAKHLDTISFGMEVDTFYLHLGDLGWMK